MADEKNTDSPLSYAILKQHFGNPAFYIHQPASVQEIQTHASYVFIAKPWVYKIKKPVDFGFLDYSSLKKRRYYCFREMELNSRLCNEIYEGVLPVFKSKNGLKLGIPENADNPHPDAVEYVVKMRYLSSENFLKARLKAGRASDRHIKRIAKTLVEFYCNQHPDGEIKQWGEPEKIKINTDENFNQTESYIGILLPDYLYDVIQSYTRLFYKQKKSLFKQRIADDCIINGHGDLHLQHIHLSKNRVCIYDCIEFNDRLRYHDYANDIAFLAMDLDFHQRPDFSHLLVTQMRHLMEDKTLPEILDFYKCYRAYVRGKVEGLQALDNEQKEIIDEVAAKKARRYFKLAAQYAVIGSQPIAFIMMGKIGTGKSTLAHKLADIFNLDVFASDRIRKQLAGLPPEKESPKKIHSYLYSREMSEKTYQALCDYGIKTLDEYKSVILDATFSRKNKRQDLVEKLQRKGYKYCFIEIDAPKRIRKKRLLEREKKYYTASDARIDKLGDLDEIYEPSKEIPSDHKIGVSTDGEFEQTLTEILKKLMYLTI